MSLPYGLLGLLTYHESTGYDLSKRFEISLNNFWHAQSSQIYRELKRMEVAGWVCSRKIIQEGRPNKRMYEITDAGREALAKWLANGKIEFNNNHVELLIRVFLGTAAPEATLNLLKECRDMCRMSLQRFEYVNNQNIAEYASLVDNGEANSKYWRMTMEYGLAMTKATLEWAENCIQQLEEGWSDEGADTV